MKHKQNSIVIDAFKSSNSLQTEIVTLEWKGITIFLVRQAQT